MRARLDVLPAGIEDAQFKRVADGYLFTTANPWVLAPRRTYLISEEQKPAIAARVRASRYMRLVVLLLLLAGLVGVFVLFPVLLTQYRTGVLIVFIAVMTAAIANTDYLMVRPLLRDVPRSSERIRLVDMLQAQSTTLSLWALAVFSLIFVLGAAANIGVMPTSTHEIFSYVVGAISFSTLAIACVSMLINRLRTPPVIPGSDPNMATIAEQLARMEFRWSMVLAFALVLVAIAVLGGLMAWLTMADDLSTAMALHHAGGALAATLRDIDGQPTLQLYGKESAISATLSATESGPVLMLFDAEKRPRVELTVSREGNPYIFMNDGRGNGRWSAFVNEKRGSYLGLSDSNGTIRWSVAVDDAGAHMKSFDAGGKEVAGGAAPPR